MTKVKLDDKFIINKLKKIDKMLEIMEKKSNKIVRTVSSAKLVQPKFIKNKKIKLDKFYTNPNIVDICINSVTKLYKWNSFDFVVEPSAGCGNFLIKIPNVDKIGLDILPDHPDVVQGDFLKYHPPSKARNILSIGNPPFGRVSSMAVKFFNHSAIWSNVIAFIIPKTFRKTSIHNKLNLYFHLVFDENIPNKPCSFTPKMGVKCCFQIWERRKIARKIISLPVIHPDWDFLKLGKRDAQNQPTPPKGADFAILAYGGKCGRIQLKNLETLRPKSWHWIKCNIDKKILISRFAKLNFAKTQNTARQNSMGKAELIQLYSGYRSSIE